MNAPTPGPWKAKPIAESSHWDWAVYLPSRDYIGVDTKNAEADARLIAAAPDLLAACIEVASGYSTRGSEMARAAIAKATGEQP
jgi:hypothetical protein